MITMASNTLLLHGERWEFQRGNHTIVVENAVNLPELFSQERVTVDGELVRAHLSTGDVIWRWKTIYETTWYFPEGEQKLEVQWRSGLLKIHARVLLDGSEQPWTDYFTAKWHGQKGAWPPGPDGL